MKSDTEKIIVPPSFKVMWEGPNDSIWFVDCKLLTSCSRWKITTLPPLSPVARRSPEWLNSTVEMMSAVNKIQIMTLRTHNEYQKSIRRIKERQTKTLSLDKAKFSQETSNHQADGSWFWCPEPMSTHRFMGFAQLIYCWVLGRPGLS